MQRLAVHGPVHSPLQLAPSSSLRPSRVCSCWARPQGGKLGTACRATASSGDAGPNDAGQTDYAKMASQLNKLLDTPAMTGSDLRQMITSKWGRAYEARLWKRGSRMYFQVMWKHLGQKSFHLNEEQYMQQLDAVADLLSSWGAADLVRQAIAADKSRGPGYTHGGSARCVSIPINVDRGGSRSGEWS